jgi:hypothetical protein
MLFLLRKPRERKIKIAASADFVNHRDDRCDGCAERLGLRAACCHFRRDSLLSGGEVLAR